MWEVLFQRTQQLKTSSMSQPETTEWEEWIHAPLLWINLAEIKYKPTWLRQLPERFPFFYSYWPDFHTIIQFEEFLFSLHTCCTPDVSRIISTVLSCFRLSTLQEIWNHEWVQIKCCSSRHKFGTCFENIFHSTTLHHIGNMTSINTESHSILTELLDGRMSWCNSFFIHMLH